MAAVEGVADIIDQINAQRCENCPDDFAPKEVQLVEIKCPISGAVALKCHFCKTCRLGKTHRNQSQPARYQGYMKRMCCICNCNFYHTVSVAGSRNTKFECLNCMKLKGPCKVGDRKVREVLEYDELAAKSGINLTDRLLQAIDIPGLRGALIATRDAKDNKEIMVSYDQLLNMIRVSTSKDNKERLTIKQSEPGRQEPEKNCDPGLEVKAAPKLRSAGIMLVSQLPGQKMQS